MNHDMAMTMVLRPEQQQQQQSRHSTAVIMMMMRLRNLEALIAAICRRQNNGIEIGKQKR